MTATGDTFTNIGRTTYHRGQLRRRADRQQQHLHPRQLSLDNNSMLNSTDLTGDVFNMPIYVPYNDVQYLGNNATFNDVDINAGTLPSGTLEPEPDRHQASSLRYVFPGGFTVAAGATLDVGANVSVLIQTSDAHRQRHPELRHRRHRCRSTAAADRRQRDHDRHQRHLHQHRFGAPTIAVNSGGELTASNSTFTLGQLSLDNNSMLNEHRPDGRRLQHAHLRALQRRAVPGQQRDLPRRRHQRRHPPQRHAEPEPDRHRTRACATSSSRRLHGGVGGDAGRRDQRHRPGPVVDAHRQRHPELRLRRHRCRSTAARSPSTGP